MIRLPVLAIAASLLALPAWAQAPANAPSVARDFLAAARSDDRAGVIRLLDAQVSVRFSRGDSSMGQAEGSAFAIGYLDGLFHGQRAVRFDGPPSVGADGAVRILAHDERSRERYVIDLDIQGAQVVGLTVYREGSAPERIIASR